jgi:hypothetical protein
MNERGEGFAPDHNEVSEISAEEWKQYREVLNNDLQFLEGFEKEVINAQPDTREELFHKDLKNLTLDIRDLISNIDQFVDIGAVQDSQALYILLLGIKQGVDRRIMLAKSEIEKWINSHK